MTGDASKQITIDARELAAATLDEQAQQMRKALRGRDGYRTYLPPVRTTRAGRRARTRAGRKASITRWRVKASKRTSGGRTQHTTVRNLDLVGTINEFSSAIRGRRNRHYGAALLTVRTNWAQMSQRAMRDAPKRVASNRIRKIKTQQARTS